MKFINLCLALFFFVLIVGCDTHYRYLKSAISSLPPKKLLIYKNGPSSVTSKIDSVVTTYHINSTERLNLILSLDKALKDRFTVYKEDRTQVNYDNVVQKLNEISTTNDIKVNIKVNTKIDGAFVRYRTQAGLDSVNANNPTNKCTLNVYLGYYYIWTIRSGKKTATAKKYPILKDDSITIDEDIK